MFKAASREIGGFLLGYVTVKCGKAVSLKTVVPAQDGHCAFRFDVSHSFNDAIEAKTTAEQLKLKAERDLQRIEVEAKQRVAQARAEAEALSVQRQQVTPELIHLREMENQRMAIEKWDGKLPNVSGGAVPFINVK
jgi:hypothetical protein